MFKSDLLIFDTCLNLIIAFEEIQEDNTLIEQIFSIFLTQLYCDPTFYQHVNDFDMKGVFIRILINHQNENLRHLVLFAILAISEIISKAKQIDLGDPKLDYLLDLLPLLEK